MFERAVRCPGPIDYRPFARNECFTRSIGLPSRVVSVFYIRPLEDPTFDRRRMGISSDTCDNDPDGTLLGVGG